MTTEREVKVDGLFTDDQRARAKALDAARAVLVQHGPFNSGEVSSVVDLIAVAQWIIDGRNPWPSKDEDDFNLELGESDVESDSTSDVLADVDIEDFERAVERTFG